MRLTKNDAKSFFNISFSGSAQYDTQDGPFRISRDSPTARKPDDCESRIGVLRDQSFAFFILSAPGRMYPRQYHSWSKVCVGPPHMSEIL